MVPAYTPEPSEEASSIKLLSKLLLGSMAAALLALIYFAALGDDDDLIWVGAAVGYMLLGIGGLFALQKVRESKYSQSSAGRSFGAVDEISNDTENAISLNVWFAADGEDADSKRPGASDPRKQKNDYKAGERMRFFVESQQAGYLTLFHVEPDGELVVLYPNMKRQNNRIGANEIICVSDRDYAMDVFVEGPEGYDSIKAIVTKEPVQVIDVDFGPTSSFFNGFSAIQAAGIIEEAAERLKALEPSDWGEAANAFHVH